MPSPFSGALARVRSASRHITSLERDLSTFAAQGAFQWHQEYRVDRWVNSIAQIKDLPEDIEFAAWDAIQNLRASLDLAVCATAVSASAENLKSTYFHFASTEEEWEKSVGKKTKAAPPFAIEIMRSLKPWESGNRLLYALSRVSAIERHQLVKPMMMKNDSIVIDQSDETGNVFFNGAGSSGFGNNLFIGTRDWDIERRELIITESSYPIKIPIPGYRFTSFLAFGEVPIVSREQFIPILNTLCKTCTEIVESFRRGKP